MKWGTFKVIPRKGSSLEGPSVFSGAMGIPHPLQKDRNQCSWRPVS